MSIRGAKVTLASFLASDFARMTPGVIGRCERINGRHLYLSGATGFFGSNLLSLLHYLQTRGVCFSVTALSRAPEAFLARHSWCDGLNWLNWRKGDVVEAWPGDGEHDLMIHAATDTRSEVHEDGLTLFHDMLAGTQRCMDFAARHGARRLLLTGSGAQYGPSIGELGDGIPDASLLACDPTKISNAYGEAKRASEMLAALHGEKYAIEIINTRCFAFVGPGLDLDGHFAIGNFIRDALSNRPLQMATTGGAVRSYLYGADLAVWLLILLLEAEPGANVNVGSDDAVMIRDLAERVRGIVNPHLEVRQAQSETSGPRNFYVPSIARARDLGLKPWTALDHAIGRTAEWYRGEIA